MWTKLQSSLPAAIGTLLLLCALLPISCTGDRTDADGGSENSHSAQHVGPAEHLSASVPGSNPSRTLSNVSRWQNTAIGCGETFLINVSLIDNTGSMGDPTAPRPTKADFQALIDHLAQCGGSAAVGAVSDRATMFVRVDIDPRPRPPNAPAHQTTDLISQVADAADDDATARTYQRELQEWQRDTDAKLATFLADITPILEPENLTSTTDLADPLAQADLFFLEPRSAPVEKRMCVLELYGDGKSDPPQALPPLRSHPVFLLVNGVGLGDLGAFAVTQVGDFRTALKFALSKGGS
jgi:hypothetical protein